MERLNQWLMLIANLGVIAGIVFLAYEIRVNTQALNASTSTSFMENSMRQLTEIAQDPEIGSLRLAVNRDGWKAIEASSALRLIAYAMNQLKAAEFAQYQWTEGLLADKLWESNDVSLFRFLWNQPHVVEIWRQGGMTHFFNKEFGAYVDTMVADICARKVCRDELPSTYSPTSDLVEASAAWAARDQ